MWGWEWGTIYCLHGGGGLSTVYMGVGMGDYLLYMGVRVETIYVWVGMGDCLHRGEGGRLSTWGWGWGLSMWGCEWGTVYMGVGVLWLCSSYSLPCTDKLGGSLLQLPCVLLKSVL